MGADENEACPKHAEWDHSPSRHMMENTFHVIFRDNPVTCAEAPDLFDFPCF